MLGSQNNIRSAVALVFVLAIVLAGTLYPVYDTYLCLPLSDPQRCAPDWHYSTDDRWWAVWATVIGSLSTTLALGFAGIAVVSQTKNSRAEKTADALMEANRAYQAIHILRTKLQLGCDPFREIIPSEIVPDNKVPSERVSCRQACQQLKTVMSGSAAEISCDSVGRREAVNPDRATIDSHPIRQERFKLLEGNRRRCCISREYWASFWSVQYNQWNYFRMGIIPSDIFESFARARISDFSGSGNHPDIVGESFAVGWHRIAESFNSMNGFMEFVDDLLLIANTQSKPYPELTKRIKIEDQSLLNRQAGRRRKIELWRTKFLKAHLPQEPTSNAKPKNARVPDSKPPTLPAASNDGETVTT